jgi:hypothetical protein
MGVKAGVLNWGRNIGTWEQGAEEDLWAWKGQGNKEVERTM